MSGTIVINEGPSFLMATWMYDYIKELVLENSSTHLREAIALAYSEFEYLGIVDFSEFEPGDFKELVKSFDLSRAALGNSEHDKIARKIIEEMIAAMSEDARASA